MSRLKTSVIVKFLAWLIIAVSGLSLVGSTLLIYGLQEEGFYSQDISEIREEYYDRYKDRYSARILYYLKNEGSESNQAYFKEKNFYYGVVQADSYEELKQLDLNDSKNYVDRNFDETIRLEDVHIFQCAIRENTYFESRNPDSLWGYYWIRNTGSLETAYAIASYVYDKNSGIFYCKTGDGFYYPVPNLILYVEGNGSAVIPLRYDKEQGGYIRAQESFPNMEDGALELMIYDADVTGYIEIAETLPAFTFLSLEEYGVNKGVWKQAYISTNKVSEAVTEEPERDSVNIAGEVSGTVYESYGTTVEIRRESLGTDAASASIITNKDVCISTEGYLKLKVREEGDTSTNYYVLSFLPAGLSNFGKDWIYGDLFLKFEHVFGTLYQYRYELIVLLLISIVVFLAAFVFLCTSAGCRKGEDGFTENFINKVPFEIYLAVVGLLEVFAIYAIDGLSYDIGDFTDVFWIVMMVLIVLFAGLLFTATGVEFFARIKMKTIFSRTIIGWICSKLFGLAKGIWEFAGAHMNMVLRTGIVFGVICFIELMIMGITNGNNGLGIFLFLIEKAILFFTILAVIIWLLKLKEAGKHVAAGDLNYKINTEHMLFDFKEHGENLNSIGEGLSYAVEERMKSERFKTELITNVSHDIKTPLTSIINYVDLLQKEDVEEESQKEYLEVLERQSARLKKLLEDLLEASKASTGNLAVNLETLEAGVFLVQTVGEFEAKTKEKQLELIIKKPEEPIYMKADGRHFWRVIDNLMNNACKYAQPNTRVYINLEAGEKEVYITFRNTSRYELNISSEELMERFVRGDSSRNTEGSGLGLSITKSLMELMHGTMELIVDGDLFKVVLKFERVSVPN